MQPETSALLEERALPPSQLAARRLLGFTERGGRQDLEGTDFGRHTADVRYRIAGLLDRFGEAPENAEILRNFEEQYRARLSTLVDYRYISAEHPAIKGVDEKEYWVPSWESIEAALTPDHLAKIRKLQNPTLLLVPAKMSLNTQLELGLKKHGFHCCNMIRGMGKAGADIDNDMDHLVEFKPEGDGSPLLERNFGFGGWRVVIAEGMRQVPDSTRNQDPIEQLQACEAEGYGYMEPNDCLMLHLDGFRHGIPYDQDRGTWLKASPKGTKRMMAGGRDPNGKVLQFFSLTNARPLIGRRRALELVPQKPFVPVEHDLMEAVAVAVALEELTPQNAAEKFIVDQGLRDGDTVEALLAKLRRPRTSALMGSEPVVEPREVPPAAPAASVATSSTVASSAPSAPIPEPPRVAEPIPPPSPKPTPPAGGRVRQTASPLGMPAITPPAVPQAAPTRVAESAFEAPRNFSDLIVALYRLYKGREYQGRSFSNPTEVEQVAQQLLQAFFSGPGKELYKDEVAERLDGQFTNIERLAQAAGITFEEMKKRIVDAAPKKPGVLGKLFGRR